MSALHCCLRCRGGYWFTEYEDKTVTVACIACGQRVAIRDGRREASEAELAAVRGLHPKHGPKRGRKPKAGGGRDG